MILSMCCLYGNIINFSHTSRIHFSFKNTLKCHSNQWGEKTPKLPLPLEACGPLSNISIHGLTPLTASNSSLITLLYNYVTQSLLVTMGCPISTPQIAPSSGAVVNPNYLPHPWTQPTHHPKRHPHLILISHFLQCTGQSDEPTG